MTRRTNEASTLICCLASWESLSSNCFLPILTYSETWFSFRIRRKRPSLRLIVSSATLDATTFLDYFNTGTTDQEATIVSLEGRMYPVQVAYLQEPAPDYVQKATETIWNIHLQVTQILKIIFFYFGWLRIARLWGHLSFHDWPWRYRPLPWRTFRTPPNVSEAYDISIPQYSLMVGYHAARLASNF